VVKLLLLEPLKKPFRLMKPRLLMLRRLHLLLKLMRRIWVLWVAWEEWAQTSLSLACLVVSVMVAASIKMVVAPLVE
jgi:hypothetical protein